ncbi:bifunctional diguanylate cyclase/phosphodiesterase [Pseudoxanthomonas wuyuanensis]|uniref:PAS domain S-box-containing protein/diguanylate cyclase (GGDEF) domain-containing protein n=1 Tax=Pseudoxanthomonas wuyuanensis TaxID=1073196 RepID=A0A286D5X9_9GAMM|nr:EAL domain-containing protein [Pseudoxanthomonas wuyuanensis]KAF1721577.1 bifunctional diguanylate cyclase/phosphodiesterase [Pseudoxanthomonas wuyuanensis]SOD54060.1 PAS domain S-box-containing protein/diguanylate cyclase (GGDEF) domain-containing protein [Pseudoxanthomonas wuyuanensis]
METITSPPQSPPGPSARRLLGLSPAVWASAVLVAGLLATGWLADREWRDVQRRTQASQQQLADKSAQDLQVPLQDAAIMLRAMQTVFLSSGHLDQRHFAQYNDNLRIPELVPGHVATVFARRQPDPANPRRVAYPYEVAAPLRGNEFLIGFNIAEQKVNLLALQRARDTDTPVISAPFKFVQFERAGIEALGVTVRLPVYSHGPIPATVAERRQREIGALAISLRLQPLVQQALQGPVLDQFRVRVRDAGDPLAQTFFDSGTAVAADAAPLVRTLEFGGRRWELQLQPRHVAIYTGRLRTVIVAGVAISLLLSLLAWSLATTRRRALAMAQQMSARFRESEARFRALNELLPALVLLADGRDGRIVYANQAARLRLGETGGVPLTMLFAEPRLRQRIDDPAAAGHDHGSLEAMLVSADGGTFWANVSIAHMEMEGEVHLLMVATDISEQRELTERLSYQASHDALTELCNRREFERRVEQALVERRNTPGGEPCALLYIDLDQFKLINDVSGHMAGDQLLVQLALTMRQQLRSGDVLARLGGDEFGLMAFGLDADGARAFAERLRQCIEAQMFVWQENTYTVSASIGVVVVDQGEPTLKDLLAWADTACYLAKENGRNRVHVYREDNETTRRHSEMEWANRLRWALDQDRLLLDYQEIVPLEASLAGAPAVELLLRLRDEDGGIVLPGTFLPAAERYGLMPAIDRWVIRNALAHFSDLHPAGARLGACAINLSGASIEDDGLADFILALIAQYAVPAHKLCFEITETVAVRNLLKVVRVIERLRQAGCMIALDDFGAGMSSFGYLKNLPADLIKIDGSFIRDLDTEPMSRTIVSAIAQIGHQRGLKVVAEWVSGGHMSATLRSLGVDYGQGFALHRPERVMFQRPDPEWRHAVGG